MEQILKSIKAVVQDFDVTNLTPDSRLNSIDSWDSMATINLQLQLESSFGISLEDSNLNEDCTISDIAEMLRKKVYCPRLSTR